MPFSASQWGRVRAASAGAGAAHLVWQRGGSAAEAFLVGKRRGGFLLAVPAGFLTEEELRAAEEEGYRGALGPAYDVSVLSAGGELAAPLTSRVTLVDVALSVRESLSLRSSVALEEITHTFVDDQGEPVVPDAAELWDSACGWLDEADARPLRTGGYVTAESGGQTPPLAVGAPRRAAAAEPSPPAAAAVDTAQLAAEVRALSARLQDLTLLGGLAPAPAVPLPVAQSPLAASRAAPLQQLLPAVPPVARGAAPLPAPPRRLFDPVPGRAPAAAAGDPDAVNGFDGPDDDEDEELVEDAPGDLRGETRLMRQLLVQTSAAVAALARRPGDDLQALLGGSPEMGGSSVGGARGAAAMEAQRRHLQRSPADVVATTRALLAEALGGGGRASLDATAYVLRYGTFQGNREAAMVAWILASVWNLLEAGDPAGGQALVGIALAAVDQWGMSGRMDVGYLWTHLPEPPWAILERGAHRQSLRPFSRLAAPMWVAASVAYLRDMETLQDRLGPRNRGSSGGSGAAADPARSAQAVPGRGRRRGRGRGAEGAGAAPAA